MTFADFLPQIGKWLGVSGSTLMFLIFCINQGAKVIGRLIPNNATGALAVVRQLCTMIGADPSSRVLPGVSVQDVATEAATTPPIKEKVEAATDQPIPAATT